MVMHLGPEVSCLLHNDTILPSRYNSAILLDRLLQSSLVLSCGLCAPYGQKS